MERRTKVFLTLLISFTIIYASVTFFLLSPRASQPFIGFGVYSAEGTLSDYFPGSGFSVTTNETLSWHFQVANRMGSIQWTRVVFRIGDLNTTSPSELVPASVPEVGTIERFIADDDTAAINFTWRILSKNQTNGTILVQINNNPASWSQVGVSGGQAFRFMFELWTYNLDSGEFQYGWTSGGSVYGSWLQVWFDVT